MKQSIKERIYPVIEFIIAIALLLAGILCGNRWCLSAGIVLFIVAIGSTIACFLRNKRQ